MKRFVIALSLLLTAGGFADARKVSGTVTCGSEKLAGVIVTDGSTFVKTSKTGRYTLEANDTSRFVFIITPNGYVADCSAGTPRFFQEIGQVSRHDFQLQKTRATDDYTLLFISDPQCKTREHFDQFMAEPFHDICTQVGKYSAEGNVACVLLGDIGWDSIDVINPIFQNAVPEVGAPVYPTIGNHDFNRNRKGKESQDDYESCYGPVNYAFWIGKDLVISLKNIIYDTSKKYVEGYTDAEFAFVKGLLAMAPQDTHIYITQHSPTYFWFRDEWSVRGKEMVDMLDGRHVDFVSGHTHISNNHKYTETIREHNPASLCGAWWSTTWNTDGTPRGFKVFRSRSGKTDWWYHPVDYSDDFQAEIILPGHSLLHPDCIIANVWDYDEDWKVEWFENGKAKGQMERVTEYSPTYQSQIFTAFEGLAIPRFKRPRANTHYFMAKPGNKAKKVRIVITSRFGQIWEYNYDI